MRSPTFNEILRFKADWEKEIAVWKPQGRTGLALFNHLFGQVWINAKMAAKAAGVSQPTAYKLIDRFVKQGLLVEMTGAKRDRIFLFDAYLKIHSSLRLRSQVSSLSPQNQLRSQVSALIPPPQLRSQVSSLTRHAVVPPAKAEPSEAPPTNVPPYAIGSVFQFSSARFSGLP